MQSGSAEYTHLPHWSSQHDNNNNNIAFCPKRVGVGNTNIQKNLIIGVTYSFSYNVRMPAYKVHNPSIYMLKGTGQGIPLNTLNPQYPTKSHGSSETSLYMYQPCWKGPNESPTMCSDGVWWQSVREDRPHLSHSGSNPVATTCTRNHLNAQQKTTR